MYSLHFGNDSLGQQILLDSLHTSNGHVQISGLSGQGKSTLIKELLAQAVNQGIRSFVFDTSSDFLKSEKFAGEYGLNLKDIEIIDPHEQKLGLPIFEKNCKAESAVDVAVRVADIFSRVYNLSDKQRCLLYDGCRRYLEQTTYPTFEGFCDHYEDWANEEGHDIAPALTYTRPLRDRRIIDGEPYSWEIESCKLTVFELSEYPESLRSVLTEIILWSLWGHAAVNGNTDRPFIVVFDECQHLSFSLDAPVIRILTEGRKFGWAAWLSTQSFNCATMKKARERLDQAATKIYFRPANSELQQIGKEISADCPDKKNQWIKLLQGLHCGECAVRLPEAAGAVICKVPKPKGDD